MRCDMCGEKIDLTDKLYPYGHKLKCAVCGKEMDLRDYDELYSKIANLDYITSFIVMFSVFLMQFILEKLVGSHFMAFVIGVIFVIAVYKIVGTKLYNKMFSRITKNFFEC